MFIERLNYEPAFDTVHSVFSEAVRAYIQSAQTIARQDEFKVVHCVLKKFPKGQERDAVKQLSMYHPHNLVVFSDRDFSEFHFTNLRYIKQQKGNIEQRIRPFRRIVIGPNERLRTASERLAMLELQGNESALEMQVKCDKAFDVEAVSREFYRDFVYYYKEFRLVLMEQNELDQQTADIHTQTIFNRFFFLYFIQKMGYLNEDAKFLSNRFETIGAENYYQALVLPLFQKSSDITFRYEGLEHIPFLNGGLFEFGEQEKTLYIPNDAFGAIFEGLFEHYNFTIREDTEFEKEVAIDPEMMGTIFEQLILRLEREKFEDIPDPRRATGSFYTPKCIVAFMVKHSLLNDLVKECQNSFWQISRAQIKQLVFDLNPDGIPEEVLQAIRVRLLDLKVVDPAVGSGAYAVGILLKIVEIVETIDRVITPETVDICNYRYNLKRHIIENCIYGVDLQARAVNLANLRLWLSLIVDLRVEHIQDIPPLPNLDYHLLCGDSLISHIAGYSFDFRKIPLDAKGTKLLDRFKQLKTDYEEIPEKQEKDRLKQRIVDTKKQLCLWFLERLRSGMTEQSLLFEKPSKTARSKLEMLDEQIQNVENLTAPFNWGLDFFDILILRAGFDIVIANPPYGMKVTDSIRREFGVESKDSYGVFTVLGLRILRPGGTLCYVMSDTWQTIRSHKKLRNILLKETNAQYLIALPPDVFKATVNTSVYSFVKRELPCEQLDKDADNWILAADFSPLKLRRPNGQWDTSDLDTAFEMLIEEEHFGETKDGYTIESNREFAVFAYRQKLITRFSNYSFFIASPKLFRLMRDVGNIKNQVRSEDEISIYSIDFNGKELELIK